MLLKSDRDTDMSKKLKDGLRDIARARPDEIATREIRGYRVEYHTLKAKSVVDMHDTVYTEEKKLN